MKNMHTTLALSIITVFAGSALVGCNESDNSSGAVPQSSADHDHSGHDHGEGEHSDRTPDVYTGIRGEIAQLPDPNVPGSDLRIHHEQIRDFKTKDGTISVTKEGIAGMRSMTMPFPLAEGVSLNDLQEGDKISFDFVVNWGNDRPAWEITKIEKLPADTELNFNNAIEDMVNDAQEAGEDMMDHSGHDHDGP